MRTLLLRLMGVIAMVSVLASCCLLPVPVGVDNDRGHDDQHEHHEHGHERHEGH